jgi:hypothetical protein
MRPSLFLDTHPKFEIVITKFAVVEDASVAEGRYNIDRVLTTHATVDIDPCLLSCGIKKGTLQ